ncbi:helix-turn-helix transcriptional regulator [Paraburkholderia sp. RL17-368-BIF-A]|uniref:helix-turn-helix transcriptional regulator n=1 Tax=Paraburkholderia sp. RL17-368-BIF-A TaxID=3031628 RepID=UPI0038CD3BF7
MNSVSTIRKRLELSQHDLSVLLGVGQSAVSQYENDGCDPSVKVARKIVELAASRGIVITIAEVFAPSEKEGA